jgi:uncharacterized membrane-anchored protein
MNTTIQKCGCLNAFDFSVKCAGNKVKFRVEIPYLRRGDGARYQDARYGTGMRVHNVMKNGSRRCTVCGAIK